MKIRKAKAGIGFSLGALTLLIAVIVALLPSIYGRARHGLANTIWDYPSKLLDLSETTPPDPLGVVVGLVSAVMDGRFPADIEELRLDIKFKHFQKIQKDRREAMEAGSLREPVTVPATIEYDSKSYRARVRLKGRLADHWLGPDRWSLRVRLRGGETIRGLSQFSLQRPRVRQLPHDQLFQFWGRKIGALTPDFEFFRLYVNGDYWGITLAEEHMSKHFLERNRRKEAPLIKFGSVDYWYHLRGTFEIPDAPKAFYGVPNVSLYSEREYRDDLRMRSLFSYAAEKYRELRLGEFPVEKLIDIPAFTKTAMIAFAWNHQHPLQDSNSRYYLNPYTLLLEPVTTDQRIYQAVNRDFLSSNPPLANNGADLPLLYQHLIQEDGFYQEYSNTLEEMKRSLPLLQEEYRRVCEPFPLDCPVHQEELLEENISWLEESGREFIHHLGRKLASARRVSNPEIEVAPPIPPDPRIDYPEHVYAEYREDGVLRIYNLLSHEVELRDIRVVCESDGADGAGNAATCRPGSVLGDPLILPTGSFGDYPYFQDFELGLGHVNDSKQLVITTTVGEEVRTVVVRFSLIPNLMNPLIDLPVLGESGPMPRYARSEGDTIYIAEGDWKIERPLILPPGQGLVIAPGTTLRFARDAYLLVRGSLRAEGTAEKPIALRASDDTWRGVYVLQADDISSLRHVTFENTNFFEDGVLQLTGAINFYRSDVRMQDVAFRFSSAEDALNIVESDFDIRGAIFEEIRSDAFDADYADGIISDSIFARIGGDALDTSGSRISGEGLRFEGIGDKAISAGEESRLKLDRIQARDIGAGVVSKDGSDLLVEHLSVAEAKIAAGMVYRKKSIYGSARLAVLSSEVDAAEFYNQAGNELSVNGQPVEGIELDVDALYREGPMKKLGRKEAAIR